MKQRLLPTLAMMALPCATALALVVPAHAQIPFVDLGLDLNASNLDFQLLDNRDSGHVLCLGQFSPASCKGRPNPVECEQQLQSALVACDSRVDSIYQSAINAEGVHLDATATGIAACTNPGG